MFVSPYSAFVKQKHISINWLNLKFFKQLKIKHTNLMEVETKVFKDGTFYLMYREVGNSVDAGQRSNPYTLQCKGKNTVII